MCRAVMGLFCLALLAEGRCFSQESNLPPPPRPVPLRALVLRSGSENTEKSQDKTIEHLLKAAEHLEAAGLPDEAARLRNDARRRALRDDLLGRKESELECLQEEVDKLRELTGQAPAVRVEIMVVEVDRSRLGLKTGEFNKLIGFTEAAVPEITDRSERIHPTGGKPAQTASFGTVDANPSRLPLFKELVENGVLNVVARPTLMTSTGRAASLHIGGELPVSVPSASGDVSIRYLAFGTQVDLLAAVLPRHRIRLRMALERREVNSEQATGEDGGSEPEVESHRVNTEVEIALGQTVTLAGLVQQRRTKAEPSDEKRGGARRAAGRGTEPADLNETIVFITPQLVPSSIVPRALHIAPDHEADEDSSEIIEPTVFEPVDPDRLGPPVPVMRRRASRD